MSIKVVRIHVTELAFMPERHRWAVDFFPEDKPQKYYTDLTKFFSSEELAIQYAEAAAKDHGLIRTADYTWSQP